MSSDGRIIPIPEHIMSMEIEPILACTFIAFMMFGIGLLQFWILLRKLRKDKERIKDIIIISILLVLDLADSAAKGTFMVIWIRGFIIGGFEKAQKLPPTEIGQVTLDGLTATFVQGVYARRLFRIIPNKKGFGAVCIAFIMCLSLGQLCFALYTSYLALRPASEWYPIIRAPICLWFGLAGTADIMLCSMMVFYLQQHRNKAEFKGTVSLITKFIVLTFETMMVPAILQILELCLFLGLPDSHVHFAVAIIQPKIYLNGVLILLHTSLTSRSNVEYTSDLVSTGSVPGRPGAHELHVRSRSQMQPGEYQIKSNHGHQSYPANGVVVQSQVHTVDETLPYQEKQWDPSRVEDRYA